MKLGRKTVYIFAVVVILVVLGLVYRREGFEEKDSKKEPEKDMEQKNGVVSAPGTVRPASATSERPTFPAAVSATEDRPFETYVQMLVRSEMAAQGVPTNEPFQVEQVIENVSKAVKRM